MKATTTTHEPEDRPRLDPLRHHAHHQDGQGGSPYAGGSSFMERMSEKVASGMGTVPFLIISTLLILGWVSRTVLRTTSARPFTPSSMESSSTQSRGSS